MTDNAQHKIQASDSEHQGKLAFKEILANLPDISGWSHNMWARKDTPDMRATRMAERYVQRFTMSMRDMHVIPLSGVEVNFAARNGSAMLDSEVRDAIKTEYRERLKALKRYDVQRHNELGIMELPQSLCDKISEMKNKLTSDMALYNDVQHSKVYSLRKLLDDISRHGYISSGERDEIKGLSEYLSLAPMPKRQKKFLRNLLRDTDPESHRYIYRPDAYFTTTNDLNGFQRSVYVDQNVNVEIPTRLGSPIATIMRTNTAKQRTYEASYDYMEHYLDSAEYAADPESDMPMSPRSEGIAMAMLPKAYRITYGKDDLASGEHLSVSFYRPRAGENPSSTSVTKDRDDYAERNMLNHGEWADLFHRAYENFLPQDTLLALGHKSWFDAFSEDLRRHHVRSNGTKGAESRRLELRTYGNSRSNIALAMLGVMAVNYAVVKTIHDDPKLRYLLENADDFKLSIVDEQKVLKALEERYGKYMDDEIPLMPNDAISRFRTESLTLEMMRQWVRDNAQGAEKAEMFSEIEGFKQDILTRSQQLLSQQEPSMQL